MITLKVEKRNPEVKAKKLRRDGFVCGVLYGKEMKESTPIQLTEPEALRFIKANKEGTQVMLDLDGKQVDALVKNIDYDPMKKQIMALDFQALVAGETVATSVQVILENEDAAQGIVEQTLNEVHYKADPANMLDTIVIDFKTLSPDVREFHVKDLVIPGGKTVHITTPEDTLIFHIAEYANNGEDEVAEDSDADAAKA
ncbi:MAG: 50S ribosomal protein L25 [Lachnospiraceae bacterium]